MSFFVFGINHKQCPIEVREKLHFDREQVQQALLKCRDREEISEVVILSTCNRVEIFGHAENDEIPALFLYSLIQEVLGVAKDSYYEYVKTFEGKDAVRYLFRVASGLESLVVGENEILGQVRDAFRLANEMGTVHSLLYRLMEKALKVGKDVRHQTKINEGAVGIPSVAVELAQKIFGQLTNEKVMVIGSGEMTITTIKNLRNAGAEIRYVVSRNQAKGEQIADEFAAEWLAIDTGIKKLTSVDIVITSTSSERPILTYDHVHSIMQARRHRPLFIIDIAVPRDVEQDVNGIDDVYLYNVDDLKGVADVNLRLRCKQIHSAEELAEEAVISFSSWLEQLAARPTLKRFESFVEDILERELEQSLRKTSLSAEERQQLKNRIQSRLMHAPIERIKEASRNGGVKRYLEALHSLFHLDHHGRNDDEENR